MSVQPSRLHILLDRSQSKSDNWLTNSGALAEGLRPLWVAALMPLFVFGEGRFLLFGILAFVALWVFAGAASGEWGRWSVSTPSLLAFLLLIPVTLWVTPSEDLTWEHLGYFLAQLIAFYTIATWASTPQRIRVTAYALAGVGCLLALSAPFTMRPTDATAAMDASPTTIQKNVLGGILAVLLPICVGLLMGKLTTNQARSSSALFAATAVGLITLAIFFSQSRGAVLAVVVSLLAIAAIRVRTLRWAIPGTVFAGGLVAWVLNLGPSLAQLLQSDSVGDFSVRVEIWSRALQAIHDFPLTGVGLGAFRTAIPALYPYIISDPEKVHHAHNLYLQIGAELGLPGLAVFVALVLGLFLAGSQAYKHWETLKNTEVSWLVLGCIGALAAMLAHGLLDAVTWGTKPAFIAWAVLGLLLSSSASARGAKAD